MSDSIAQTYLEGRVERDSIANQPTVIENTGIIYWIGLICIVLFIVLIILGIIVGGGYFAYKQVNN